MRRVEGPANHLLGNSSQGLFEGWILELIRGIEETRLTFVCTELKAAASSTLTRERVRVQVWPLESQTASLQPQCEALIMSKYRQRFLHLACRILSEPCESAPRDGSQLKAPNKGRQSLRPLPFCCLYQSPRISFLLSPKHNDDIVQREQRQGAPQGKMWKRGSCKTA